MMLLQKTWSVITRYRFPASVQRIEFIYGSMQAVSVSRSAAVELLLAVRESAALAGFDVGGGVVGILAFYLCRLLLPASFA